VAVEEAGGEEHAVAVVSEADEIVAAPHRRRAATFAGVSPLDVIPEITVCF
jgi:hypothetical protein